MRALLSLTCGAAALTAMACGAAPTESGNTYVVERALEAVEGGQAGVRDAFIVTPVTVDPSDPGCSINGIRFANCRTAAQPSLEVAARTNVCEIDVQADARYFAPCQLDERAPRPENVLPPPEHCPGGK